MRISDWSSDVCSSDLADVLEGVLGHRDDPLEPARHAGLHRGERVPALQGEPLVPALGRAHLEAAVDGDRVVDRGDHRDLQLLLDGEQAVAQALVVVNEVEVALAVAEVVPRPYREGKRRREAGKCRRLNSRTKWD